VCIPSNLGNNLNSDAVFFWFVVVLCSVFRRISSVYFSIIVGPFASWVSTLILQRFKATGKKGRPKGGGGDLLAEQSGQFITMPEP
jgi:hypothetical protein